eukprot:CAMPEP_0172568944 /NCGR_PEP_ID=MMETSP1067-20121228/121618_1 /TAXON_ID=265564 ORGANISM="Thalassiosira punctigera, Strain Tpunct2005C2" /NCGR_SAMPLE_ID=MMETSP1067 /ASSEMBLY_ACC=CAM_ASM_000444 /LENGTH=118 /DNA_ID=CAMNT_0013360675 /DNA_START=199 /DNA_END=555 /DNA_ORIENTATION=-
MLAKRHLFDEYLNDPKLVSRAKSPSSACDDISFSMFAVNFTQSLPSFVPGEKRVMTKIKKPQEFYVSEDDHTVSGRRYDLPEHDGLSVRMPRQWVQKRSSCLEFCIRYFGKPLVEILV